jgi:hypothetical protein
MSSDLMYEPRMTDDVWSSRRNDSKGKPKCLEKTWPSIVSSTINPT